MPKNNHVYNHFNKTIENAFAAFIDDAGITTVQGAKVNLATAKAATGSNDAKALAARLPKAWPKFLEIATAPEFTHWDTMQDTQQVVSNDQNSTTYGRVAASFVAEVKKIAKQTSMHASVPGRYWQEMVNVGFDQSAATDFIDNGGSSNKKNERAQLVASSGTFVRGKLNGLVSTWIQYLKLDIAGKK